MKAKKLVALLVAAFMAVAAALTGCTPTDEKTTKVDAPTMTYLYNTSSGHQIIGEYIQSAFKAAGITITMENQEWATFLETRKNGDYTVARNGWLADYNDPISFLDMWTTDSGNNDVQFGKGDHATLAMYDIDLTDLGYDIKVEDGTWSETYDVLIKTIKTCTDTEKRYEMMHRAEDLLMSTGCITPIYYYTDIYMVDDSVEGFFGNPLGYKYFMYCTVNGSTEKINVCIASDPSTIDPALNSSVDGATLCAHLMSGLAKWAQDDNGNLILVADSVEELVDGVTNADGTVTYTYTLRDGLTWSNGDAVKASDFANSWKRAASTALGADYGYMFEVIVGYGDDDDANGLAPLAVVADDEAGTITVTLNNAVSYWNELLAFPAYYPVHSSAFGNDDWATSKDTYISNGAYVIDEWTVGSKIVLKKNANYVDADSVKMEEIDFYFSDDDNTMLANFENGDWQMIDSVPNAEIDNLKTKYPTEFYVGSQLGTYYVCWNINADLLPGSSLTGAEKEAAQAEIRQALSLVIDRNYVCEEIGKAGQEPASSFVALGMTDADGSQFYKNANKAAGNDYVGYYDVSEDAYADNCAKAAEILNKYYNMDK